MRAIQRCIALLMLVASTSCDKVDVNSPEHRAAKFEVLRALLDSEYNQTPAGVASGTPEILLTDHFASVDTQTLRTTKGWLKDSIPEAPRALVDDLIRVATDHSSIDAFPLGGATLRLVADSTIAHFFAPAVRHTRGWDGFRRAFPRGKGIVSVSRVGLSRDGRWAIVYAGVQSDWLAGSGSLYVLSKQGAAWRVRHQRHLWIS